MPNDPDINQELQDRFAKLPKVVQDAITSAEIEAHLRQLAETHKLHLDQWELLENEVMLTLLGFQPATALAQNIQSEVGVDASTASALATDISTIVFAPIREALERELAHPSAPEASEEASAPAPATVTSAPPAPPAPEPPVIAAPPVAPAPAPSAPAPVAASAPMPISPGPTSTPAPEVAIPLPATAGETSEPALVSPVTIAPTPVVPATPPTPPPAVSVERTPAPVGYTPAVPSHARKTIEGDPYREPIA